MLFLTACAYLGAAFFGGLSSAEASPPAEVVREAAEYAVIEGIAIREETVTERDFPDGERVSAAVTGGASAVYFAACDGYEALDPSVLLPLTAEKLEEVMSLSPDAAGGGRLVTGRDWVIAAFSDRSVPEGGTCRVRLDGLDRVLTARIRRSFTENGRNVVLLRLTDGGTDAMKLRKITGKVYWEQ